MVWKLSSPQPLKVAAVCVVVFLLILCLLGPGSIVHHKHGALDIRTLISSHKVSLCRWQSTATVT